jgi:hypothetical protein
MLYEPVTVGGGDGPAALFSSSVLWEYTERKVQANGIVGQILTGRHIHALYWCSNLIEEHGGEAATFAANTIPHWPDIDGDILFREADIAHLQRNGFIEVDKQVGGSVTYRYGSRAKAIIASYRDTVAKKARDTAALRLGRRHAAASTTDTSPSRRQRPATADFL